MQEKKRSQTRSDLRSHTVYDQRKPLAVTSPRLEQKSRDALPSSTISNTRSKLSYNPAEGVSSGKSSFQYQPSRSICLLHLQQISGIDATLGPIIFSYTDGTNRSRSTPAMITLTTARTMVQAVPPKATDCRRKSPRSDDLITIVSPLGRGFCSKFYIQPRDTISCCKACERTLKARSLLAGVLQGPNL